MSVIRAGGGVRSDGREGARLSGPVVVGGGSWKGRSGRGFASDAVEKGRGCVFGQRSFWSEPSDFSSAYSRLTAPSDGGGGALVVSRDEADALKRLKRAFMNSQGQPAGFQGCRAYAK